MLSRRAHANRTLDEAQVPAGRARPAPLHPVLAMQRAAGNQAVSTLLSHSVQRAATVSVPSDPMEREADETADQVMRMAQPPAIQRMCKGCEEEHGHAQRAPSGEEEVAPEAADAAVKTAGRGGSPLPDAARSFFEPRFGQDFGHVRVHADAEGAQAAKDVQARAYTVGSDIVFAAGEYAPETAAGQRLLAHELTHVVQQSGGIHRQQVQREKEPVEHGSPNERPWTREHPEGEVTVRGAGHWVLWNFDVGSARLKPGHLEALRTIAPALMGSMLHAGSVCRLDGHASRSGTAHENESLSSDRVMAVYVALSMQLGNNPVGKGVIRRMEPNSHGFSQPWLPNLTGGTMAHNRRVEIQIVHPPPPPPPEVETLEPPEPEPAPPPEGEEPGPVVGPVDYAWSYKHSVDPKVGYPLGCFVLYPRGEIAVTARLLRGGSTLHTTEQDLKQKLEQQLTKDLSFEETSAGEFGFKHKGAKLGDIQFSPEVQYGGFKDPDKVFFNVKTTPFQTEVELFGNRYRLTLAPKFKFGVGPGPNTLACLAEFAPVAGGVAAGAGAAAFIGLCMYEVIKAKKEGEELGLSTWRKRGYAYRLAAFAMDRPRQTNIAVKALRHEKYDRERYRREYAGWLSAEVSLASLTEDQKNRLRAGLFRRFPIGDVEAMGDAIEVAMGFKFDEARPLSLIEP